MTVQLQFQIKLSQTEDSDGSFSEGAGKFEFNADPCRKQAQNKPCCCSLYSVEYVFPMMFQTGRRQPNSPSKKPPDPGPALWKCSLMSSGWWGWPCLPSPLWSIGQSPSPVCSSIPLPQPPCPQEAGDPASSWSCSCSWSTLFSKCLPSLRVESTLKAVFCGLIPPSTDSSS